MSELSEDMVKRSAALLAKADVYDARFIEYIQHCRTYEEAWEMVEEEYRSVFKENKYASYESYRKTRKRRMQ